MKKQEVKIVKAAVQRSAKLDRGMKVKLGLTDAKESETVFALGPAEGAADVITLLLNDEPVSLAVHELETVAQMVRICLTPQVRTQFLHEVAEVLNAIKASDGEGERLVKSCTEAEQWRLCLVYMLPNDALGARQAKETIAWLNLLNGVFWKSTAAVE